MAAAMGVDVSTGTGEGRKRESLMEAPCPIRHLAMAPQCSHRGEVAPRHHARLHPHLAAQLVGDSSAPALLAQLCVDTWGLLDHADLKDKSVLLILNKRCAVPSAGDDGVVRGTACAPVRSDAPARRRPSVPARTQ